MMKKKIIKVFVFISFLLLFISFINKYLSVPLFDFDVWWHIATGRYIVENKALPENDPFSFVNDLEENKNPDPLREQLILKQYWLAQIIFYKTYDAFGDKGIILLRSALLLLVLFFIFWWFNRQKVSFFITYPFVFIVFLQTYFFTGERPVLFTILFSVIVFIVLDDFKQKKSKLIFSLIPVMFVWANLHGGFILGIFIILAYLVAEIISLFLKRSKIDKKASLILFIVGLSAVAVSSINPNGFGAFLSLVPEGKMYTANIQEYQSLFSLYQRQVREVDWEYIILVALFPLLAVLRNKKTALVHYLLLFGLLFMSITALRFVIYYVCISAMILGRELYYLIDEHFEKVTFSRYKFDLIASILILVSSILFASGFVDSKRISLNKAEQLSVPKDAADFIKAQDIQGNMFNDMGYGGYLAWRLYPLKKIFIDTRQLNVIVRREFVWIARATESIENPELPEGKKPLWERLLDHYKINLIVLDTVNIMGQVKPVIFKLLKHEKWVPVYCDSISVVFVRDVKENREIIYAHRLPEDFVYNRLIASLTSLALRYDYNPEYLIYLGDVFYNMGKYDDALEAYTYADNRHPNQIEAKEKIVKTKKQLEKEKQDILRKEEI
jgi:hypothetical protein